MEQDDFKKLEKYHENLERMVRNQAISHFDLKMKDDVINILTKYGRMTGMCGHCNSHLLSIAAAAVRLYNENKNLKLKDNATSGKSQRRRKKDTKEDTETNRG